MASKLLINNKTTWIIVADESAATIFERKARHGQLTEILQLGNEAGRKKAGDLISDRGGRSFDSHGHGRHTMTKEKGGPKQRAIQAFAKSIASKVTSAVQAGRCDQVALIAAPRFLGVVRDALAKEGKVEPVLSIDKEMVGKDAAAIEKLLDAHS